MEHPTRYFTYQRTDFDAAQGVRNYYKCRLLRDLAYESVWREYQPVTMHNDESAKQYAKLELIQEARDRHLYGWNGDEIVLDFVY